MFRLHAASLVMSSLLTTSAVFASCSCLTPESVQDRRARQQAMAHTLPSESDRLIAQGFHARRLDQEAETYYLQAVDKSQSELTKARSDDAAKHGALTAERLEMFVIHKANIESEASALLVQRGKLAQAAELREQALNDNLAIDPNVDVESEYKAIAQMYEAGQRQQKSAEFYKRLADHLQSTKGRYSPAVASAMAQYTRLSKANSSVSNSHI